MALPAGITTTIVTMGSPVGFDGSNDIRFEGTIQPIAGSNTKSMDPITWAADGTPLIPFPIKTSGETLAIALPDVDQDGFTMGGAAFSHWAYRLSGAWKSSSSKNEIKIDRVFQCFAGQGTLDLDKIAAGATVLPIAAVNAYVRYDEITGKLLDAGGKAISAGGGSARNGLTIALLGDSITNQNSPNRELVTDPASPFYSQNVLYSGNLWFYTGGQGFWTWANARLGHRFTMVSPPTGPSAEFGRSGAEAAHLISEGYVAAVVAAKPAWCHVLAGRNDASNGATAAQIIERVQAIVTTLTESGIRVILSTILPTATESAAVRGVVQAANRGLAAWGRGQPGVIVNDWYAALIDPTTGAGKPVYFADGTHPFGAGASRIGYVLARTLMGATPDARFPVSHDGLLGTAGAYQLGTAGAFGGGNAAGGSGQLATGVICYLNSGVTVVASKVPRTDEIAGAFWQQIQQTAGGVNGYSYTHRNSNVGVDWSPGESVFGVVEYQTDQADWAANQLFLTLRALPNDVRTDAAGNTSDTTLYWPAVAEGILVTPPLAIPEGATYLRLDASTGGGTSTVRWGRMQIYKV